METKGISKSSIIVTNSFWNKYFDIVKEQMLPFQWDILHDQASVTIESERDDVNIPTEKSHVIENFLIAAGKKEGHHYGWLFQDSDLYKWIEAAANTYLVEPNEDLLQMMQQCVEVIEDAQDEDGYLSTFYQIDAPELKFRRLFESHELYCAGHLIEAAIAYAEATGDERLLRVADRFITCIENNFGPEEGKIDGTDGHQEIELALVRLYEYTGKEKYLALSDYFLKVRGQDPQFFQEQLQENIQRGIDDRPVPHLNLVYHQAHKPVVEQDEAVGHAVRLVYMAQAMAGTAHYLKDEKLLQAAKAIWNNIVHKRMYITGGIGSTVRGEAFTYDYDLPTDLMYCETCAAIGLLNFTHELQKIEAKVAYADIMERILYNSMISGMSLDGKHFFYVNPLEVDPEGSQKNPDKSHVKATRPSWFGCACCPPNLARTIPMIQRYIYQTYADEKEVWVNQWIDSEAEFEHVYIQQSHDFDLKKASTFTLRSNGKTQVKIRIPYWLENVQVSIDGEVAPKEIVDGYITVALNEEETVISITYDQSVLTWQSHPSVKSSYGKVAFQYGPFIYAAEEVDNGKKLHELTVVGKAEPKKMTSPAIGSITALHVPAYRIDHQNQTDLYQLFQPLEYEKATVCLIPYYSWANRDTGEMRVWLNQNFEKGVGQ